MEENHSGKPKKKLDDFLLTIKGNAPHGKVRIELDFKSGSGLSQDDFDAYLLSTIWAIGEFRKEMCSSESHQVWMKKNFPHYAREIERRKTSSYVA
jgi:hypothetical protein